MKNKIIGIIPARMAASRFPGKPLKLINGMPMLMHVYLELSYIKIGTNLVLLVVIKKS